MATATCPIHGRIEVYKVLIEETGHSGFVCPACLEAKNVPCYDCGGQPGKARPRWGGPPVCDGCWCDGHQTPRTKNSNITTGEQMLNGIFSAHECPGCAWERGDGFKLLLDADGNGEDWPTFAKKYGLPIYANPSSEVQQ